MLQLISYLHTFMTKPLRKDDGATAVEYGLLVVLIAAVIVGVVAIIGQDVLAGFETVEGQLPDAP